MRIINMNKNMRVKRLSKLLNKSNKSLPVFVCNIDTLEFYQIYDAYQVDVDNTSYAPKQKYSLIMCRSIKREK